jgi:hypothetical protein
VAEDCPEPDTGVMQFMFIGDMTVCEDSTYVQGHFGYEFLSVRDGSSLCAVMGELEYEGAAPRGCPDCDWSFDLSAIQNSVAGGTYCDDIGITDGYLDGYIDYSWGFAETYYYDYGGTPIPFENTVLLYTDYWFPFSFNYGGRDWVEGDSYYWTSTRPVISGGEYVYYYYYR